MKDFTKVAPQSVTHHDTLHDIYFSMRPMYIICKMAGLNPIRFKKSVLFDSKKYDWLYFSFHMIIYSILSTYSIICILADTENYIVISKYIVLTECTVMITLMFIVVIFTFFTRQIQMKAFSLLAHIDATFIKNNFPLQYKHLLKNNYVILIFMALSLLVRSSLMLLTVRVDVFQQATLGIACLIKALSKYQFVVFVLQLQLRFAQINNIIRSFYDNSTKCRLVLDPVSTIIPQRLYVLCRLHYKLTSVVQKINAAFAVQLLVSIAVSLSDVLFQAYFLYYVFSGKGDFVDLVTRVCPVVWLVDEVVEIYWLVYACASTCEQANETPTILHELRNNCFDVDLESHIQTYSLQMLHQKVQFSVLGFFVIDYTLIYSIVGAVTTYLVIFIQFDQSASDSKSILAANYSDEVPMD